MKTLSLTVHLISAATAVAMTLVLLNTVFAIAEPQRSVLIARMQHSEQPQSVRIALAMASKGMANSGK
jgi:hypothetical protein